MIEDGSFRCDCCGELIPDVMLWIETKGTYKSEKSYVTFRWDFCDLQCLRDYLETKVDFTKVQEAKHKVKKRKKK